MSELQKKLLGLQRLPPKPAVSAPNSRSQWKKKDYSTLPWSNYFDSEQKISPSGSRNVFHFYKKGASSLIIVFLHGAGFSGLSWALLSSSLSKLAHCCCIALDQRGHGQTLTDDESNFTAEQLASDVGEVVDFILRENAESSPRVVLVGHSMGGAVAIHALAKHKVPNVVGLIVIDVVEGSALENLHAMHGVLQNRPRTFESIEKANEWCIRTGHIRNLESVRVSMIGQLKKLEFETDEPSQKNRDPEAHLEGSSSMGAIAEDEEDGRSACGCCSNVAVASEKSVASERTSSTKAHHYTWRIDLSKTAHHWKDWFKGMSSMFLSIEVPKLLLLAGIDRLDTQLTTAQMQGKFQMQVLSKSGHAVHEDVPDKVAEAIATFLVRHKFAEAASDFKRPFPIC